MRPQRRSLTRLIWISKQDSGGGMVSRPFSLERTRNDPRSNPRSNRRNRSLWRVLCHAFEFRVSYPITRTISRQSPPGEIPGFSFWECRLPGVRWRVAAIVGVAGTHAPARRVCRWRPVSGPLNHNTLICPELSLFLSFGRVHVLPQSRAEWPMSSFDMANSFGGLTIFETRSLFRNCNQFGYFSDFFFLLPPSPTHIRTGNGTDRPRGDMGHPPETDAHMGGGRMREMRKSEDK